MRKLKIYLDTSVINFLDAPDAPDYMKITVDFFENYLQDFDVYISEIVLIEIHRTPDENRKEALLNLIEQYCLGIYSDLTDEIGSLAEKYISQGVIPENKNDDAMHIAFATFYEFDILLSWNFKHLANIKKQLEVNSINEKEGFTKQLLLINPLEVLYEKE